MIVWNVFFDISFFTCSIPQQKQLYAGIFLVFYPIVGWLGDCKFGKYKVLQAALYFLLASIVLYNLSVFVCGDSFLLTYSAAAVGIVAALCYVSSIAPFLMDQMIGASGEELSFTIYWALWGVMVGWFIADLIYFNSQRLSDTIGLAVSSTSFLTSYFLFHCFSHHLNTNTRLNNPVKLIAQVLNYARKHKFPKRRSALTYWEEDYPSRLDLGKEKYGGPFTFEEVEDVKTVIRLLPLIVTFFMGVSCLCFTFFPNIAYIDFKWITKDTTYSEIILSPFLATIFALPFYHFIFYPIFYNYIPSLLKRIGFGLLLSLAHCITSAMAQYVWLGFLVNSDNATCIFNPDFNATTNYLMVTSFAPNLLGFLFLPIIAYFPVEFLISQTPHQIKGITLSVACVVFFFFLTIGDGVVELFTAFQPTTGYSYCGVYYYVFVSIFSLASFVSYAYFSRKYKLRVRDDIIPVHQFAEDFFEKEYLLRKEYLKEIGFESSDQSD